MFKTPVKPCTIRAQHVAYGGAAPQSHLIDSAYADYRQSSIPAHIALTEARKVAAKGKCRFPAFHPGNAGSNRESVWFGHPEAFGLRMVGESHSIASGVQHRGWYLDEWQDETVCGVVYRLPSKRGESRFIAGYADPWNDGAACLDMTETYDCEVDAAYAADSIAENMAEREREFRESEEY